VRRATTICCSALALIALAKAPEPIALVPLRQLWTLPLNSHLSLPPAYDPSRGYFAIEGDRLVAYDIVSGKQIWLVEAKPVLQPAAADDLVYVTEANQLSALRAADGKAAWHLSLTASDPLATRPGVGHGWLVGVTKAGRVLAVRAKDGREIWQRDLGSPPQAPPTLAQGRVYVPTANGRIVALENETGELIWERHVGGLPGEILAIDTRVYAGSTDNYLYCLMAKDGRIDWRWRTGGSIIGAPVADAHSVYFLSRDNVVRALDQTSGGQYWMKPLPFRPTSGPQLAGTTLVVAGQSPAIKTFNTKNGAPAPDIPAGEDVAAPPQVLWDPATALPMLAVVTRNIVKGDTVALSIRTTEPAPTPFAPLPNPVTPAPITETRP
jgi:outer membrane protein assembly factor BamB